MKKQILEINKADEFIIVPLSWFERLDEIAKTAAGDDKMGKQYLLGYLSSATTIMKYAKRVPNDI